MFGELIQGILAQNGGKEKAGIEDADEQEGELRGKVLRKPLLACRKDANTDNHKNSQNLCGNRKHTESPERALTARVIDERLI